MVPTKCALCMLLHPKMKEKMCSICQRGHFWLNYERPLLYKVSIFSSLYVRTLLGSEIYSNFLYARIFEWSSWLLQFINVSLDLMTKWIFAAKLVENGDPPTLVVSGVTVLKVGWFFSAAFNLSNVQSHATAPLTPLTTNGGSPFSTKLTAYS